MNYTDYSVINEGARMYRLTLPCFSDDDRFYDAARMNRFYSAVMDRLCMIGESLKKSNERRTCYSCAYKVTENGKNEEVELIISLRCSNRKAARKSIIHVWENGYIVSERITDKF
ncbi:MAG: hypothetical protein E7628_02435 [Ruminococcaceae bacterium]|nr:hypothetical protein [Oscillospiraceae bacterium]